MTKVLLMILDGWGIGGGAADPADAISAAHPAFIESLDARYPHAELRTYGENVGLPEGQMGNSEVGHLNIGAGRVVYQDLVRINRACAQDKLLEQPECRAMFEYLKASGKALHLMGLFSDGGVHASFDHLLAFIDLARREGIEHVYVHAFMDGRDTDPKSGLGFVEALERKLSEPGERAQLVSLIGRYYAMDRDKRWERIEEAWQQLVNGKGTHSRDLAKSVRASYAAGVTDEFIKPVVKTDEADRPFGTLQADDAVLFINFRNDRARELTSVLTQAPQGSMHPLPLWFATMTPYDAAFKGLHVLFAKENVVNPIGEYVSSLGLKQLRIAETEKYAHVTFFLNGGREEPFANEDRILVPSPKVATYDLQPEMSAPEVAQKLSAALLSGQYDFICLNFANGDMVGHTGVWSAIEKAVRTVDDCVKQVIEAAQASGTDVVIIADHGNADHARNADGSPNTAHSLNPVPIIVVSPRAKAVHNGVLADVAPTVLTLMGVPVPPEMTGKPLVELKA